MGPTVPYGITEYMLSLSSITEKVDNINESTLYCLSRFIICKFLSAYGIYGIERQVKANIQYRSVNKKVHTLDKIGLNNKNNKQTHPN